MRIDLFARIYLYVVNMSVTMSVSVFVSNVCTCFSFVLFLLPLQYMDCECVSFFPSNLCVCDCPVFLTLVCSSFSFAVLSYSL